MSVHKKILEMHGVQEIVPQAVQPTTTPLLDKDDLKVDQLIQDTLQNNSAYIRATTAVFPRTRATYQDAKLPFGVIITLCGPQVTDGFPSTSFGNLSILRCSSCRTYINPFMTFLRSGSYIQCNICDTQDPLPSDYQSQINPQTGKRQDYLDRIELHQPSYDIRAGQDYQARPPMPPTYFFMVDVSLQSKDIIPIFCSVLKQAIQDGQLQGGDRTMFGILTYDETIQIYNLQPGLKMPQMYVMSDPTEKQFPIPDDLLVNLKESQDQIVILLDQMDQMFKKNKIKYATQFTRALELSQKIFSHVGGKLFIITSSSTITKEPPFQSKVAEEQRNYMLPSSPMLSSFAGQMHCQFISPTTFIFSNNFCNAITQSELARYTNGDTFYYDSSKQECLRNFFYDFKSILTKPYTWESVFRLRVSRGWKVKQVFGNYSTKSTDLLSVTNCEDSKTLSYELELDDASCKKDSLYLQSALLYTSALGERRLRVHNYQIPLTYNLSKIYEYIDSQSLVTFLMKQTLYKMYKTPVVNDVRNWLQQRGKEIIQIAIKMFKQIPPSLEILPMYLLGILKNKILTTLYVHNIESDIANSFRLDFNFMGTDELLIHFVPLLFRVDDFTENCCVYVDGQFIYPPVISLTIESIEEGGLFIMDCGSQILILIAKKHDEQLCKDVFGDRYMEQKKLNEDMLYNNAQNMKNTQIYYLLQEIRRFSTLLHNYLKSKVHQVCSIVNRNSWNE